MAILSIRNLPESTRQRLRMRAAQMGRSMEAEARAILIAAVEIEEAVSPTDLQNWIERLYNGHVPQNAVDELIAERRQEALLEP